MRNAFIIFCLFILVSNVVYLFYLFIKYYVHIKRMSYKIYFKIGSFNVIMLSICAILFIGSIIYCFIESDLSLIPSATLFLVLMTSRIKECIILKSNDNSF